MSLATLGFVGVGRMGTPMTERLLAAGYRVVVYDKSNEAMSRLVGLGAESAPSAKAVADSCEIVLVSLPTPEILQAVVLGPDGVSSGAKVKTLKNLARELAAERLNLEVLANEDADAAHNTLTKLHGIGPWTADVYLLFCLGHGDAWPAGDLAVQEAVKIGLGLKTRPTPKEMAPLAEPWRPLRGAAAHLWWTYYRALKKREGVIGAPEKTNAVLNKLPVAKATSAKAKITAAKTRDLKK